MAINPYGLVILNDFGNPKIYSGYAREVISGGQFVNLSGVAEAVSSGADSFSTADITFFVTAGSSKFFGGVALKDVESGQVLPVLAEGVFIVTAGGTVLAGQALQMLNGDHSVVVLGSDAAGVALADGGGDAGKLIGRALNTGASGNYVVAYLRI